MLYSLCSMQFCINKSNLVCAHLCPSFSGTHRVCQPQARRLVAAERRLDLADSNNAESKASNPVVRRHSRSWNSNFSQRLIPK